MAASILMTFLPKSPCLLSILVLQINPGISMSDVDNCSSLSEEEIRTDISQMKNGKAPGVDQISAELLKAW
jgi:hypothetical protein